MNIKVITLTFLFLIFKSSVLAQQSSEVEYSLQFLETYSRYYENTPKKIDSLGKLSQDQVIRCEKELVIDTQLDVYQKLRDSLDKTVSKIIDIALEINGMDSLLNTHKKNLDGFRNTDTVFIDSIWKKACANREKVRKSLHIYFKTTFPPIGDSLDLQEKKRLRYKFTGIKL